MLWCNRSKFACLKKNAHHRVWREKLLALVFVSDDDKSVTNTKLNNYIFVIQRPAAHSQCISTFPRKVLCLSVITLFL